MQETACFWCNKGSGNYDNPEDYLTKSRREKRFIAETGVDCLAVAVGTSHGVYVHEPKLDFERLELLNSISDIPMVVHGGSGTPDDQIKKAISLGVTKLNIYSEMMAAYFGTMKEELEKAGTMAIWMSNANREPLKAVKKVVKEKNTAYRFRRKSLKYTEFQEGYTWKNI